MSICDPNSENSNCDEASDFELQSAFNNKPHIMYQKLIIKHCHLKKLSLWGCSGLDVRYIQNSISVYQHIFPLMFLNLYI